MKKPQRLRNWLAGAGLALGALSAGNASAGTAFVHLFEWSWNDIASECENFLGPKGFDAVQISPPQEHISLDTWWARYQPVTYTNLTSRGGTEAELASMIGRCHAAGVKVYVDMVINHTAAWDQGGTGWGGTPWAVTNHPEFSPQDYHSNCTITNYGDTNNVWNCRLSGLPDLNTGSSYVQDTLAAYFNKLKGMGVDGFRIDAVKHMSPGDLQAILNKAGNPWVFSEVIGAAGEASEIQPPNYTYLGHVTEFKYGPDVAGNFNGQIKNLASIGESWGLLPSNKSVHFIDNHDRERGHGGGGNLTYKDGVKYNLANVFMLAHPYGYPKVMSGYAFSDTDIGPPSMGPQNCTNGAWVCQHRWANIANMVGFRNYVDGTSVANWWDNGNNQIAFSRGDRGFVVINNEGGTLIQTLYTGLPAGDYCNVLAGEDACSGEIISVDNNGYATFNVAADSATAIHGGAVSAPCTECVAQNFSQLNFRGTANDWAAGTMELVADHTWQIAVSFDGQADQRFKFDVFGDWSENYGDDGVDGVLDLTGSDIYTSVVGDYLVEVNDQNMTYSFTPTGPAQQPPSASVIPGTATVEVNQNVTLDASGSSDSDGSIVSYSWSSGGSGSTRSLSYTTAGTYTETVMVTDNDGLADSATATITVTDPDAGYISNFASLSFRGTPNSWGTQAMTLMADHIWQATVVFDGSADQRFKFDVTGDWSQNYGSGSGSTLVLGGGDIYASVSGAYLVEVNDQTLTYSLSCSDCTGYQSNFSALYFRGTPNSWGGTAMELVADNTWEVIVEFDGQADQRFKFDVNADWSENYGDNSGNGVLEQDGADIYTGVAGTYKITVNDQDMSYSIHAQ